MNELQLMQKNNGAAAHIIEHDTENMFENYRHMSDDLATGDAKQIIKGSRAAKPVIIVGSGSSLDAALPMLSKWEGAIFCTPSQAATLHACGCHDLNVLILDTRTEWRQIADGGPDFFKLGKKNLYTHPGIHPAIWKAWQGDKHLFRCCDERIPAYVVQAAAYKQVEAQLRLFSSSIPAMVGIAQYMGHSPIFLVGCDMSAKRFSAVEYKTDSGTWYKHGPMAEDDNAIEVDGVRTTELQLFYRRSFYMQTLIDRSPIISCSTGILARFPYRDLKKVINQQGKHFKNAVAGDVEFLEIEKELIKENAYLIRVNTEKGMAYQWLVSEKGMAWVIGYLRANYEESLINITKGKPVVDIDSMNLHFLYLLGKAKESPYYVKNKK